MGEVWDDILSRRKEYVKEWGEIDACTIWAIIDYLEEEASKSNT